MAAVHLSAFCNNQYGDLCLLSQWLLRKRKEKRLLTLIGLCRYCCHDQRQYRCTILLRFDVLDSLVFTLLGNCMAILLCSCHNCHESRSNEVLSHLARCLNLGLCSIELHPCDYSYAICFGSYFAAPYGPLALDARYILLHTRCRYLFV